MKGLIYLYVLLQLFTADTLTVFSWDHDSAPCFCTWREPTGNSGSPPAWCSAISLMIYTRCMKRGPSRTSRSNGSVHQRLSVEVTESYKHVPGSPDSAPVAPLEAAGLCNAQHGGKPERGEKNRNRQLSEPIVVKTSPFCTALGDLTLRAGLQPVQGRGGRGSSGCCSRLAGRSLLCTTCWRGVEKVLNPGPARRGPWPVPAGHGCDAEAKCLSSFLKKHSSS